MGRGLIKRRCARAARGIGVARLAWADRDWPAGRSWCTAGSWSRGSTSPHGALDLHRRRLRSPHSIHQVRRFRYKLNAMPFVITDPCIGTKDSACVDVCPVDCIHPRKDEPEFEQATMLYIHPDECIDCGACVPACPVAAIYDSVTRPRHHRRPSIEANSVYRAGDPGRLRRPSRSSRRMSSAHADLMAVPPAERAAAHAK